LTNNVGPQVRRRRYALGWSQSDFAAKLQIAGFDISRSGVSKIEARLSHIDDKALLYLAEVLKVQVQELFPRRTPEIASTSSWRNWRRRDSDATETATIVPVICTRQLQKGAKNS
jgi:transcriptional regulator with XRE-family HTH domain